MIPTVKTPFRKKSSLVGIFLACIIFTIQIGCKMSDHQPIAFEALYSNQTGLDFNNQLTPTPAFNMFKYMYYYNGAGIGVADFNNDGLIDAFFAANQVSNKLFLNQGNLHFKDFSKAAGIPIDSAWSTGVSVVDINNDGLLDIYVCRVSKYESLKGHNQLLICTSIDANGVPHYQDQSNEYGLDFSGFSTQAAFLDYDQDGDLDMFLLNHSAHQKGGILPRTNFIETFNDVSGDKIFNNQNNYFKDVTKTTGINSSANSFGLGVVVVDINLDGYPDIYVGNDFHENDYLYINQKDGSFKDESTIRMSHTSQYSMGVDAADLNNDGFPEIVSLDMLPNDPLVLKRSQGEDSYDIFNLKIRYGYHYQYTRNNLQFNRKNGLFSETGLYAGIAATDWSWAPLLVDFDNDGLKDLFVSNGISKRMNDLDFINFISNEQIQEKIRWNNLEKMDMDLIDKFPQIKLSNKFFVNNGNLAFSDLEENIKNEKAGYSNGAVYADFDNDGDLDILVNNIDAPAILYANKANDKVKKPFASITLKGSNENRNAIGAKLIIFSNNGIETYEKSPVRGYLSSMETPIHIGLNKTLVDSAFLLWPDNQYQSVNFIPGKTQYLFSYSKELNKFNFHSNHSFLNHEAKPMVDITSASKIVFKHEENVFNEFNREPLLPHLLSTEGPALAVGDANGDGLDDVYLGAAKGFKSNLYLQQKNGQFVKSIQPSLSQDSIYEDVDATWVDINNDGHLDLVVASGGNEYYHQEPYLLPRAYLNDGKMHFTKLPNAFSGIVVSQSCVIANDFNDDGFADLFIGGRSVPYQYGTIPTSYLLMNDGNGHFKNVTEQYAKGLSKIGMVTQAVWNDLDKDGKKDLLICSEWGGIDAFINKKNHFNKIQITDKKGWWNCILPVDIDNDGDIDIVAGNLGLNSRLTASDKKPVRLYFQDFDDNGKKEQVLTYFLKDRELVFANKSELERQMPFIKKKYLYAGDFSKAAINEIFTTSKLNEAIRYSANYFSNTLFLNNGQQQFSTIELPFEAQLSPIKSAVVIDANGDDLKDLLLVGNYYDNTIQMGRNDADYGTILINKGKGNLVAESINGLSIKGQVRKMLPIVIQKKNAWILAKNGDNTQLIQFKLAKTNK